MTGTIASNLNAYRLDAQRYQINSMGDIQEFVYHARGLCFLSVPSRLESQARKRTKTVFTFFPHIHTSDLALGFLFRRGMDICTPSSLYLDFPAFDMAVSSMFVCNSAAFELSTFQMPAGKLIGCATTNYRTFLYPRWRIDKMLLHPVWRV